MTANGLEEKSGWGFEWWYIAKRWIWARVTVSNCLWVLTTILHDLKAPLAGKYALV